MVAERPWWQLGLKWVGDPSQTEVGGRHKDTGKPTTMTREEQPELKGSESHINMSLKHQITSLPNNGFTGEVRERGKHWHSSVICGDVDEVLWFPAVFENIVPWKTDRFLPPTHTFSPSLLLPLLLTQIQRQHNRWSWSLENTGTS